MKNALHKAFYKPESKYFSLVNDFFAIVTIIAILGIILETVERLSPYAKIFLIVEYITVFLFTCEYIARILAHKKPLSYIFSFFGFIDLVSILPTFFGFANLSFLKSTRILRMLRFFRLLRLVRIMYTSIRQNEGAFDEEENIHSKSFWLKIEIYIIVFTIAATFGASAMWFMEGNREEFANIPVALLWSTKVLLGGVASTSANTPWGEIIVIITRFIGLILFGLLVNIIGGILKKILFGKAT